MALPCALYDQWLRDPCSSSQEARRPMENLDRQLTRQGTPRRAMERGRRGATWEFHSRNGRKSTRTASLRATVNSWGPVGRAGSRAAPATQLVTVSSAHRRRRGSRYQGRNRAEFRGVAHHVVAYGRRQRRSGRLLLNADAGYLVAVEGRARVLDAVYGRSGRRHDARAVTILADRTWPRDCGCRGSAGDIEPVASSRTRC